MRGHGRGRGRGRGGGGGGGGNGARGGGRGGSKRDGAASQRYLALASSYGNSPEEIARWKRERTSKFPRTQGKAPPSSSLLAGFYSSSSEAEGDGDAAPALVQSTAPPPAPAPAPKPAVAANDDDDDDKAERCRRFVMGTCAQGDQCSRVHDHAARREYLAGMRSAPSVLENLMAGEMEREASVLLEIFRHIAVKLGL